MFSVVIRPAGEAEDLAGLFARLVPAAVEGLVREVLYAGPATAEVEALCDASGARIAGSLEAALAAARGPWLLIAPATFRPTEDWQARAAAHVAQRSGPLKLKGSRAGGLFSRAVVAELRPLGRR